MILTNFNNQDKELKAAGKEGWAAIIERNQLLADQYEDSYKLLKKTAGLLTDPNTRKLAELHLISTDNRFGAIRAQTGGSALAQQAEAKKEMLFSRLTRPTNISQDPKNHPIFPDAKTGAIFDYFYKNMFYDYMIHAKPTQEDVDAMIRDPKILNKLRNHLTKQAYQGMVNFKILDY
jgi:hypothetical protein